MINLNYLCPLGTGESLDFGYEAFMKGMFGHNILFSKSEFLSYIF